MVVSFVHVTSQNAQRNVMMLVSNYMKNETEPRNPSKAFPVPNIDLRRRVDLIVAHRTPEAGQEINF